MKRRMEQAAAEHAIVWSPELASRLTDFVALFLKWNQRVAMTSTKDADELVDRHIIDSFAVVRHVAESASVIDVGSGGGFPGVVLALCRPDIDLVMLEPIRKKHAFLATARRELDLPNMEPRAERVEDHPARYDVAVSRATWAIPEWLERGAGLVHPGGLVIGMEGRDEHELPPGASRHPYQLAGGRKRAIILYRPSAG